MPPRLDRKTSIALAFASALPAVVSSSDDAQAVMRGQAAGAISKHMVKLVGTNLLCTATVVARDEILTVEHCVEKHKDEDLQIITNAGKIQVVDRARSGAHYRLKLKRPLPKSYQPIAIQGGRVDGPVTIAGFGAAVEAERMHSAGAKEAHLIFNATQRGLVDVKWKGQSISASACMGDSGGPVAKKIANRFVLLGLVERVSNYAGIGACGFVTHFSAAQGTDNQFSWPGEVSPLENTFSSPPATAQAHRSQVTKRDRAKRTAHPFRPKPRVVQANQRRAGLR